jgi:hypothetical protein
VYCATTTKTKKRHVIIMAKLTLMRERTWRKLFRILRAHTHTGMNASGLPERFSNLDLYYLDLKSEIDNIVIYCIDVK